MVEPQGYVCWGASGHALVLTELVQNQGACMLAFFDQQALPTPLAGVPLYVNTEGFAEWAAGRADLRTVRALVAIGHCGPAREQRLALFRQFGLQTPPLVASNAVVSASAQIGAGCQILPLALVAAQAKLGEACIVNHAAVIEHECVLAAGVHVAPRATLCGCVRVGQQVFIGAGSVILPRVVIGDNAIIGAGAVVTRDVPAGATVTGNPARIRKDL